MSRLCFNISGLLIPSRKQVKLLVANSDNLLKFLRLTSKNYAGRSIKNCVRSDDYDRF